MKAEDAIDDVTSETDNDGVGISEAGMARRLLQTVFRIKKKIVLKTLAKHSDKLSDVSDLVIKVSNAVDTTSSDNDKVATNSNNSSNSNNSNNSSNSNSSQASNSSNRSKEYYRLIKNVTSALPSALISNIIIGSVSFLPYENRHHFNISPTTAGLLGGTMSGMLTISYDKLTNWKSNYVTNRSIIGTVLSHSLIHASLFASYEHSKHHLYQVFNSQGLEDESIYASACIGGFISGITSEILAHTLVPFELNMRLNQKRLLLKLRQQLSTLRYQTIVIQALPSSFGFLAYEFGLRNL